MDPILLQAWDDHRRACPACANEAARDANLCAIMAALPTDAPPAATWAQVIAEKPNRQRIVRRPAAWALAGATVAALALMVQPFGRHNSIPTTGSGTKYQSADLEGQAYTSAHVLGSVGDPSSDPNRAILIAYSRGSSK